MIGRRRRGGRGRHQRDRRRLHGAAARGGRARQRRDAPAGGGARGGRRACRVDEDDGDLVVRARPEATAGRCCCAPRRGRCRRAPGGSAIAPAGSTPAWPRPWRGWRRRRPARASRTRSRHGHAGDRAGAGRPAGPVEGFDLDPEAVACARRNAAAAGVADRVRFELGDASAWPQADGPLDLVLADPPWGDAVGSRAAQPRAVPGVPRRGGALPPPRRQARLGDPRDRPDPRALAGPGPWRMLHERRVWHGGHHPWVLVLERARAGRAVDAGSKRRPARRRRC
jgi:hypothetical protein